MRSLLFVPADSGRKIDRALGSGVDAIILDLEDSVAAGNKDAARAQSATLLGDQASRTDRPRLYVRINGFATGLAETDLDAVVAKRPEGILLPKAGNGADVALLSAMIGVREALADLPEGAIRIIALATETGGSLFTLGTYAGSSSRLAALTWGAEDLSAALGAERTRRDDGALADPYRLARTLVLAGAAAAEVPAIDTVFLDYRDSDSLAAEAEAARRDGFSGKLAIHPDQVPVINEAFTPGADAIARAEAIVAAFAAAPNAGAVGLDGEMVDRPHLVRAQRILAAAKAYKP